MFKLIDISKESWHDWIIMLPIFLTLILYYPYIFERILPVPSLIVLIVVLLLWLFVCSSKRKSLSTLPYAIKFCVVVQSITWLFYFVYHSDTSYITRIVLGFTTYYSLYVLNKAGIEKKFALYNVIWLTIQAAFSMIAFVLCFVGILHPLFEFVNLDNRTAYFFGISSTNTLWGNLARMAGYFDEPGALATWGVFALVYNKLFYKNRIIEYTLVIGLFSTLSLAYFVAFALYLFCFYVKDIKRMLPFLLICVAFGYYVYINQDSESKLYEVTINRIEQSKTGDYGRNELANNARMYFFRAPILGNGAKYIERVEYINDNYLETFVKDGILGTIILYLPLLYVLRKRYNNWQVLMSCLILIACYLQRPFHINMMHYLMLYGFCSLTLSRNNSKFNYI